jgi:hypothetical protein
MYNNLKIGDFIIKGADCFFDPFILDLFKEQNNE